MRTISRNRTVAALLALALVLVAAGVFAREELAELGIGGESQEQLARAATVTRDQAQATALATVPGSVKDIELEREDGRVVYEVGIRPQAGGEDMEVLVDAMSGEVVKAEED